MSALSHQLEKVLLDLLTDAFRKARTLEEMHRGARNDSGIAVAERVQEAIASALAAIETGGAT